jgi:hypothetical protein
MSRAPAARSPGSVELSIAIAAGRALDIFANKL